MWGWPQMPMQGMQGGMPQMPMMGGMQQQMPPPMMMGGMPMMMGGMQQQMPPMMMAQQTQVTEQMQGVPAEQPSGSRRSHAPSRPSSKALAKYVERRHSGSRSPRRRQKDDHQGVSSSFKSLGLVHRNANRSCPRSFRCSLINACDNRKFPMMLLNNLDEEAIDMLLFVATGVSPASRPANFNCATKGDVRDQFREIYEEKMTNAPGRLNQLAEEWDNVGSIAMKMGYKPQWLSDESYQQYQFARQAARIQSSGGMGAGHTPSPPPESRKPLALADSSEPVRRREPEQPRESLALRDRKPLEAKPRVGADRSREEVIPPVVPLPPSKLSQALKAEAAQHDKQKVPVVPVVPEPKPAPREQPGDLGAEQASWSLPSFRKKKVSQKRAPEKTPEKTPVVDRRNWFRNVEVPENVEVPPEEDGADASPVRAGTKLAQEAHRMYIHTRM